MTAPPLRLDHVVFPVHDAEAAHRFYADVLGLPLVDALSGDDWGGKPWLMMIFGVGDGRQIVLVALRGLGEPPAGAAPEETRHYAFSVASSAEQDGWRRRLTAHGVRFRDEDHGPQRSIYFTDPDGVTLEITAPPSEAAIAPNPEAPETVRRWLAASAGG